MKLFENFVFLIGCLSAEVMAFFYLREEGLGGHFGISHVLAALWFALYLYYRGQDRLWRDRFLPVATFSFLIFSFFPGIGILGVGLLLAYRKFFSSQRQGLLEDYEQYVSEHAAEAMQLGSALHVLRQKRFELGFEPFVDILLGDKTSFKATVIRKLSDQVTPANIQLLQMALKDSHPEIRLYAAGAVMKIESQLNEQVRKVQEQIKVSGTFKDYAELGDLCRMFAVLNLSGGPLSGHYWQQAAEAYQKSLDINTNQPQTISYFCRTLMDLAGCRARHAPDQVVLPEGSDPARMRKERPCSGVGLEKAKAVIDRAVKIWPENPDIVFLRNELYFQMGLFEDIADRFAMLMPFGIDDRKQQVISFWVDEAAQGSEG